ncbi:MAG: LLM class flavin-dependent oxidoreductase [Aeromicrobium sp.]
MQLSIHSSTSNGGSVSAVIEEVAQARDAGARGYWAPMLSGIDTLSALAAAAALVDDILLCTAVVPIPVRSPFALAQQALTIQEISHGRLVLGIGTSHEQLVRQVFRQEWAPPVATMRTYLEEFRELVTGAQPERLRSAAPAPPVLLGAVNPVMARLAAESADGIVTWAAGLQTVAGVILPAMDARAADRPFRVVLANPLCVTADEDGGRAAIHAKLGRYDDLPSYRRVFDREGVQGIAELAVVGDEAAVRRELDRFDDAGVTEFAAHVVGSEEDRRRTWAFLTEETARRR